MKSYSPRSGRLMTHDARAPKRFSVARFTGSTDYCAPYPSIEMLGYFHASALRTDVPCCSRISRQT